MSEAERQAKKIVYSLLIILLVFVALVFLFQKEAPGTEVYDYNGFEVQKIVDAKSTHYRTKVFINKNPQPVYMSTRYEPASLEYIEMDDVKANILGKKEIFVTIDPFDERLTGRTTVAALELNNLIEYFYSIPINSAFTNASKGFEVKTCEDAGDVIGVIWLKLGDKTKIIKQGDCVILEGQEQEDLIKLADRLAFDLLGII